MKIGVFFSTAGRPDGLRDLLAAGATTAEEEGFHSIWFGEHVVLVEEHRSRYPYAKDGKIPIRGDNGLLEPFAGIAYAAALTRRIRLGTGICLVPQRSPIYTAKQVADCDVLSGGRVDFGVGIGWLREEFEALGAADFDRRGAVSDEYIRIFKTLWTQSPASFEGTFYRFKPLRFLPPPVQKPHPPIWIGGHSPAALRRVARLGDGWHPVGAIAAVPLRPAEMRASLDELRRLTEKEGRDPSRLTISFKAPVYDTEVKDPEGRRPFSGTPEQVLEDVDTYGKLGVSELMFDFRSERLPDSLERMERFAALVKPRRD